MKNKLPIVVILLIIAYYSTLIIDFVYSDTSKVRIDQGRVSGIDEVVIDRNKPTYALRDYNFIIGCINTKTLEIRKPINESVDDGGCFLGKGSWSNILAPTKEQFKQAVEVFGSERIAINRLPIINTESQFDENARGYHKFGVDCGYVQIRDIYGGCNMKSQEQLEWLRDRAEGQKKPPKGNCSSHWDEGERAMMGCIYARHRGDKTSKAHYPQMLLKEREVYFEFFNQK